MAEFTPNKIISNPVTRKAIYGLIGSVVAVLVAFGVITEGIGDQITELITGGLTVLATILAGKNTPKDDGADDTEPTVTDELGQ